MKSHFSLFLAAVCLLVSCGPDSGSDPLPKEAPKVNLEFESAQVSVDQVVTLKVSTDRPLQEISRITGNAVISWLAFDGESLPRSFEVHFRFPNPGTQTLDLEFRFTDQTKLPKQLQFEVTRGNSVQLTGVEVNSFRNIHESWDPEFGDTDPQRLADVEFVLEKLHLTQWREKTLTPRRWYKSAIKENQGDLSWDLSEENLFLDPNGPFFFAMGDNDGNNLGQDLMEALKEVRLRDYMDSRPESISVVDEASNLDVTFHLDWP